MKQVQEELNNIVGIDRMVEETDLPKLKYLYMVIKETMRLHPPGPLLLPHESIEDVVVNDYYIPKGSRLIVNAWAIGRDPKVWSNNVEEFDPSRFAITDVDLQGQHFELIPFGAGRRVCPGMQMGLRVVQLVMAQLLHCFNWELPHDRSITNKNQIQAGQSTYDTNPHELHQAGNLSLNGGKMRFGPRYVHPTKVYGQATGCVQANFKQSPDLSGLKDHIIIHGEDQQVLLFNQHQQPQHLVKRNRQNGKRLRDLGGDKKGLGISNVKGQRVITTSCLWAGKR
ncbi:hypothetical protein Syun_021653 [Stephania yunnanensis]|uniref:Cytochrome P450 n=1 Tax=Stephania yunnanensis TaxID=152371 RepID=A0AAP0IHG7_9MAGN